MILEAEVWSAATLAVDTVPMPSYLGMLDLPKEKAVIT